MHLNFANFDHYVVLIISRRETQAKPLHPTAHTEDWSTCDSWPTKQQRFPDNRQQGYGGLGAVGFSKFPDKQTGRYCTDQYKQATMRPQQIFHTITERIASRFLVTPSLWTAPHALTALDSPRCVLHVICLRASRCKQLLPAHLRWISSTPTPSPHIPCLLPILLSQFP